MSDGLIESGWAMLQAGNHDAAIAAAKQVLQSDPNDFDALFLMSRGMLSGWDYAGAQAATEQILRLRPDAMEGHLNRVEIPMYRGLYQASKDALDAFREACPQAITEHQMLSARWEQYFGDPKIAIKLYRDLLAKQPTDIDLHRSLGLVEYEVRNPFRAERSLAYVLENKVHDAKVMEHLAFIRFRQFAFDKARSLAASSRQLDPSNKPVRWASWASFLVWFPPFLVGHILQWLAAKAADMSGPVAGHMVNLLWIVLTIVSIVFAAQANQSPPYLPIWQGLLVLAGLLATAWAMLVHYVFGEDWGYEPYADTGNQVRLKDY